MKRFLSLLAALAMLLAMGTNVFAVEDQLPPDVEVPGTADNPILVEFEWDENWLVGTATVVAPVGTTYYSTYYGSTILSINGEDVGLLIMNGCTPAVFVIVNEGDAPAEYALQLKTPVGDNGNPEQMREGSMDVSLRAEDYDGHYYTWTAEADGALTVFIEAATEGTMVDIIITNENTRVQKSLVHHGEGEGDDRKLTVEVKGGDKLMIQVGDLYAAAAEVTWNASFDAEGEEVEKAIGDINGDARIDQSDVAMLFDYVIGRLDIEPTASFDLNGDTLIDQSDVAMLFDYVIGRLDSL